MVELNWSDRSLAVYYDDPESLADAVVRCSLDHYYDRTDDGVPYGVDKRERDVLAPIVARHLSAARADWEHHTVDLSDEGRAAFFKELIEALKKLQQEGS
jgi:hypothetical protein